MDISVADIQLGMGVHDCNGQNIGTVNQIINAQHRSENHPGEDHLYVQVTPGNVLEFWRKELYVPVAAINNVDAGICVTLNVSKDEVTKRFADKPVND